MERDTAGRETVGRYTIYDKIGAGGMATVYAGRLNGPVGFTRAVAIKRLHPGFAAEPELVTMLLDEARIAARVRHPNVVPILDVVTDRGELFLVMEYVNGVSLSQLLKATERVPMAIAAAISVGVLSGLHAAHEACGPDGRRLEIVHRDVSPQNILIGEDGIPRVIDFGIAKAIGRLQTTREGSVKGKLSYMAPEQWLAGDVSRAADIYAVGVVLWEMLTGKCLVSRPERPGFIRDQTAEDAPPPSSIAMDVTPALDQVVLRALRRDPSARFETAHDMVLALEEAVVPATSSVVASWTRSLASEKLSTQSALLVEMEAHTLETAPHRSSSAPAPRASVDTSTGIDKVARRQRGIAAAAFGVTLLGAATIYAFRSTRAPAPPSAPTPASVTSAAPASSSTPREESSETATAPSSPPASSSAQGATKPLVRRRPPSRRLDCDPPYVLDRNGLRLYKPECVR